LIKKAALFLSITAIRKFLKVLLRNTFKNFLNSDLSAVV